MKTNDIKKGTRLKLACGWYGTMADNKKGNTRIVDVEGFERETGSVYAHDIVIAKNAAGEWEPVEHTPDQILLRVKLRKLGW